MIIRVTQEDIAEGTAMSDNCPLVRALHRQVLLQRKWMVQYSNGKYSATYFDETGRFLLGSIHLPLKVVRFLVAFDNGEKVEPISFRMRRLSLVV